MLNDTRKGIALIAASLVNHQLYIEVGDTDGLTRFTGRVGQEVNVYDAARSRNISGFLKGGAYTLYDFGTGTRLSLTVRDLSFHGVDERSGEDFHGTVNGAHVELFDEEVQRPFAYHVR